MKVIRAGVLGFCMGVSRAVSIAEASLDSSGRVFSLGPLIHNPSVLGDLEKRGLLILDENNPPPSLAGASVIIRAHGVAPGAEAALAGSGARIVDATCPKVKASQLKARALAEAGRRLFLAGEARHGEVIGIQGYAGSCAVVADAEEAGKAARALSENEPDAKTALIGQTTISEEEFFSIAGEIRKFFPDLEVVNTICGATRDRQEALRVLAGNVEALIVAGGKESANTRRLLFIARELGKPCWLAESAAEIPPEIFSFNTVGLCAGASTPGRIVDEIESGLCGGAR